MGIILYSLLCGGLPFDDDDESAMKEMIIKGEYEEPDWLSQGTSNIDIFIQTFGLAHVQTKKIPFAHRVRSRVCRRLLSHPIHALP
jgi:hypothetical protein